MAVGAVIAFLEFSIGSVLGPSRVDHIPSVPDKDVDVSGGVQFFQFVEELDQRRLYSQLCSCDNFGQNPFSKLLVLDHSDFLAPIQNVNFILFEFYALSRVKRDLVFACNDEGLISHIPFELLPNFFNIVVVH